jgi:anti-sigma B factor antagonist
MTISIRTVGAVHVVELAGELDANTAPAAQQQILPLTAAGARILLDMQGVSFMSSAGLRLLLSTYRQLATSGGVVALAGLSEELQDTMSMTGFLSFFQVHATAEGGVLALQPAR